MNQHRAVEAFRALGYRDALHLLGHGGDDHGDVHRRIAPTTTSRRRRRSCFAADSLRLHARLSARVIYERPSSRSRNLGAYVETNDRSAFWFDNADLITANSATVLNFDVHYDPPAGHGLWSRSQFYFEHARRTGSAGAGVAWIAAGEEGCGGAVTKGKRPIP